MGDWTLSEVITAIMALSVLFLGSFGGQALAVKYGQNDLAGLLIGMGWTFAGMLRFEWETRKKAKEKNP